MASQSGSVQRSFRLSARTSELLDRAVEVSVESRNALVDRLLGEALRTEHHPLIRFLAGASGHREPVVVGTRLRVRQVISTLRGQGGDVDATAELLAVPESFVRAAVAYYADFSDEVDADMEWAERFEADERRRWERQRAALA